MEQRTYHQYCATARTLDVVGERWTLLLVRELLTGPKRFGDLQRNLRGLGTGLLAARLKHLEQQGIVRKTVLPPPARTAAYVLTAAGDELVPVVLSLAQWGMRWAMADPRDDETFEPGWAVLGLKARFDRGAATGIQAVCEFRIGDEVFHARIHDCTIETNYGPAQQPDFVLTTDYRTFRDIAASRTTLTQAVATQQAAIEGDGTLLRQLSSLFPPVEPQPRLPRLPR
ncbi:winged helix-turn-helix transcriptional regulator [Nocardia sp. NBC_00511]|uniref:winged helix-turn-helix transcriptional regulator n=1 Tax=Nocardia sp. NBC_00511 TaxID=2903591 RepID=UPI002F91AE3E